MSAVFVGQLVEGELARGLHVVRQGAGIRAVKDRVSVVEPPARPIAGVGHTIAPHTVESAPEHLVPGVGIIIGRVVDHAGAVQPDGQDIVVPGAVVFDQTEVRLLPVEPVSGGGVEDVPRCVVVPHPVSAGTVMEHRAVQVDAAVVVLALPRSVPDDHRPVELGGCVSSARDPGSPGDRLVIDEDVAAHRAHHLPPGGGCCGPSAPHQYAPVRIWLVAGYSRTSA